jgi:hypothetical protein
MSTSALHEHTARLSYNSLEYEIGSIDIEDHLNGLPSIYVPTIEKYKKFRYWIFFSMSFLMGMWLYNLYTLLSPSSNEVDVMNSSSSAAAMNSTTNITWTNSTCTTIYYGEVFGIGALIVVVAIPLILWGIGLSLLGPTAGGWFAANMGASLSAGTIMAFLQSLAMGGNAFALWIISVIGALCGGLSAIQIINLLKFCETH